jgi:DNA-binding SARP family transcriptional activator/predicted ATPase
VILELSLLGTFRAAMSGRDVAGFPTRKTQALLALLGTEGARAWPREHLVELLWPERPAEAAATSLRTTLHRLRATFETLEPGAADAVLDVRRATVGLREGAWTSDLQRFETLVASCDEHRLCNEEGRQACLDTLERALACWRGDFLDGLTLPDAPSFDAWSASTRARLLHGRITALERVASLEAALGRPDRALTATLRLLDLDPLHEPARRSAMRLLGDLGRTAEAIASYDAWRDLLRAELGIEPEAATVELVDALRGRVARPEATRRHATHAIPPQATPCYGRGRELDELGALLEASRGGLVTLLGPGGIGKTRLATELAGSYAAAGRCPDGIHVVPLAHTTTPDGVVGALAAALEVTVGEGEEPLRALTRALRDRDALIVLDNLEQARSAAPALAGLAAGLPTVRFLVTSRIALELRAERRFVLGPLEIEGDEQHADPTSSPAIRVFLEAALRVRGAPLPDEELAGVVAVCRAVAGVPLGLELAASWTRTLACSEIAAEIEHAVAFLDHGFVDLPERHRSMAAVFEHSFALLRPAAARALAAASVFADGFELASFRAVTGAGAPELAELVDHSLVRREPRGRFAMHELVRQFAFERLAAEPPLERAVRDRHAALMLGRVAGEASPLRGRAHQESPPRLVALLRDVREAWAWSHERGDRALATRALEGVARLHDHVGSFDAAAELLGSAVAREAAAAPPTLLTWHAHFLERRGATEEALARASAALQHAEAGGDPQEAARAHHLLGHLLLYRGRYDEARVHQEAALAVFEARATSPDLADALTRLGTIEWRTGRYDRALAAFERALPLQLEAGDDAGRAQVHGAVAGICWERGDLAGAETHLRRAAELFERLEHRLGMAYSAGRLALLHSEAGRIDAALQANAEALRHFETLGYDEGLAHTLGNRGSILIKLGAYDDALQCHERALALDERLGHAGDVGRHHANIGMVLAAKGEHEAALVHLDLGLARLREPGSARFVLIPLLDKGRSLCALGRHPAARVVVDECLELARRVGNARLQAEADALAAEVTAALDELGQTP